MYRPSVNLLIWDLTCIWFADGYVNLPTILKKKNNQTFSSYVIKTFSKGTKLPSKLFYSSDYSFW